MALLPILTSAVAGTYKAEAYNQQSGVFSAVNDLFVQITVDETFDNDHRVVSQKTMSADSHSKFTFSAADSGLHRLCFTPSGPGAVSVGGWFTGAGTTGGGIKLTLDLAIGETTKIESEDKGKIETMVTKVKELNSRLVDIRREQVFQRVSVACNRSFTDLTRHRNGRPSSAIKARPQTHALFDGH